MKLLKYFKNIQTAIVNHMQFRKLFVYVGDGNSYVAYIINGKTIKSYFTKEVDLNKTELLFPELRKGYKLIIVYDLNAVEIHDKSFSNLNFNEKNVLKIISGNLPYEALIWSQWRLIREKIYNKEFAHVNTAILNFEYFENIASELRHINALEGIHFRGFITLSLLEQHNIKLENKLIITITISSNTGISILAIERGIITFKKIEQVERERSIEYIYGQCKHIIETICSIFESKMITDIESINCVWILPEQYQSLYSYAQNSFPKNVQMSVLPDSCKYKNIEEYLCDFVIENHHKMKNPQHKIIRALSLVKKLRFLSNIVLTGLATSLSLICAILIIKLLNRNLIISDLEARNLSASQEYQRIVTELGFDQRKVDSILNMHSMIKNTSNSIRIDFTPLEVVNILSSKIHHMTWYKALDLNGRVNPAFSFNCSFDEKRLNSGKSKSTSVIKTLLSAYLPNYVIQIDNTQSQINEEMCRVSFICQKK